MLLGRHVGASSANFYYRCIPFIRQVHCARAQYVHILYINQHVYINSLSFPRPLSGLYLVRCLVPKLQMYGDFHKYFWIAPRYITADKRKSLLFSSILVKATCATLLSATTATRRHGLGAASTLTPSRRASLRSSGANALMPTASPAVAAAALCSKDLCHCLRSASERFCVCV